MAKKITDEILEIIRLPIFASDPPETIPEPWAQNKDLADFYEGLIQLRGFIKNIAEGNLQTELHCKGFLAGLLKSLQANLRHMTWQTHCIAGGDFSQRLDFLGEFTESFNSMVVQLDKSIQTIKKKEEQLERYNLELLEEMSKRKTVQVALEESEAHYRKLTETMRDVVWILENNNRQLTYISPSATLLLGWQLEEFEDRDISEFFEEKSWPVFLEQIELHRDSYPLNQENKYFSFECELKKKDGNTIWTDIVAHFDYDKKNKTVFLHCVLRDITDKRAMRMEMERQATTDELTNIHNRRYFIAQTTKEIERSLRYGSPACFLMLDIDHFKVVNDTFGHNIGDEALKALAQTCQQQLRSVDIFGRLGGEEFAVFMPETNLQNGIIAAERLRRSVESISLTNGKGIPVLLAVSIGISTFKGKEDSLNTLMARSDKLLYQAKKTGRNRVCADS